MARLWVGTVSALLFVLCGEANAQHRAETRIGELFLGHDTAIWRVDGAGGRFTLSCLAETCEHAVFAVEVEKRPGDYCGEEEVRQQAAAHFTFADRHPVNTFGRERFALVMAESRAGPDLYVEEAVFACLTRDDFVYRFVSVPQAGKYPGHTGGILLNLLEGGLRMPPPKLHRLEVGNLAFTYASDRWRPLPPLAEDGRSLICLPPTCAEPMLAVGIQLLPDDVSCQDGSNIFGEKYLHDQAPRVIVADDGASAIRFELQAYWTGCRNWTPPHLVACAVHDGQTYRISAGGGMGCRGHLEVPEKAFIELIETAEPR